MSCFSNPAPPPDSPASWLAVASLAVGSFALVTAEFLPVGLLPAIAADIGVSHGQAGLMVTMPGFVAALAAPLTIAFAGTIDRRRLLTVLLAFLVASSVVAASATSLAQLVLGRILLGVAVGGFWTVAGSLGPRLRPGAEGIRASALVLSGISLGTVAGVPAGSLLGGWFGWRVAFLTAAALAAVATTALVLLLPRLPSERRSSLLGIPALLSDGHVRLGLSAAVLIFIGQFAAYTYVTPFLNERAGISGTALGAVLLGNGIAGLMGNVAGGWMSSRSVLGSVVVTAFVLGGSVLLLLMTGSNPGIAPLWVVTWGFGFGMVPIAMQSWLFGAAPHSVEGIQAVFVTVVQLSIGGGALVGGALADRAGVDAALVFGSAAALSTGLLALAAMRHPKAPSDVPATCA
ncbi:MFS transporter [Methylorubrum extorquens]|uniref:MFS transporter n=1 Tax=Methylorubrum extorquens TaxID=408 RepID=A0A1S1P363_METEX|nr:MFS transporter [Methylorubrum extorquens]